MKADTRQMKKAEAEMIAQIAAMNRILEEVGQIRRYLLQFAGADEIVYLLRNWEADMEFRKMSQLRLAMALENISEIYETREKQIIESADQSLRLPAGREIPAWQPVISKYREFMQNIEGGGENSKI